MIKPLGLPQPKPMRSKLNFTASHLLLNSGLGWKTELKSHHAFGISGHNFLKPCGDAFTLFGEEVE